MFVHSNCVSESYITSNGPPNIVFKIIKWFKTIPQRQTIVFAALKLTASFVKHTTTKIFQLLNTITVWLSLWYYYRFAAATVTACGLPTMHAFESMHMLEGLNFTTLYKTLPKIKSFHNLNSFVKVFAVLMKSRDCRYYVV